MFEWAKQSSVGADFLFEVVAPLGVRKLRA